jgi:N-succinyldiaminopimelate aminotransferase
VLVTAGATEALAGALLGMLDAGDEVVVFEPMYDSYQACIALAGAAPGPVLLRPPDGRYVFDPDELRAAVSARTKLILLNTPHNPTGKVFTATSCARSPPRIEHDLLVVTDEVYEHLVFDGRRARPDGDAARDGRAHAHHLVGRQDVQHHRLEDRVGVRAGAAGGRGRPQAVPHLRERRPVPAGDRRRPRLPDAFYPALAADLEAKRDRLSPGSSPPASPRTARRHLLHDRRHPPAAPRRRRCRVLPLAARPLRRGGDPQRGLLRQPEHGRHLVRFACCKRLEVIDEAVERLATLRAGAPS